MDRSSTFIVSKIEETFQPWSEGEDEPERSSEYIYAKVRMTFSEVFKELRSITPFEPSESPIGPYGPSIWFQTSDPDQNHRTGESTYTSLHVQGSPSAMRRFRHAARAIHQHGLSTGSDPGSKIVATSFERYNGGVRIKRLYGSSTVTRFYVHFARDAKNPMAWKKIEGYGPTPGERKTDAIRKFLANS